MFALLSPKQSRPTSCLWCWLTLSFISYDGVAIAADQLIERSADGVQAKGHDAEACQSPEELARAKLGRLEVMLRDLRREISAIEASGGEVPNELSVKIAELLAAVLRLPHPEKEWIPTNIKFDPFPPKPGDLPVPLGSERDVVLPDPPQATDSADVIFAYAARRINLAHEHHRQQRDGGVRPRGDRHDDVNRWLPGQLIRDAIERLRSRLPF